MKLWMVALVVVVWQCHDGAITSKLVVLSPLREREKERKDVVRVYRYKVLMLVGVFNLGWADYFSLGLGLSNIYIQYIITQSSIRFGFERRFEP